MSRDSRYERQLAVRRYLNGEKPSSICTSLGKSRFWLYKWVNRFDPDDPTWCESRSTRPFGHSLRTPVEIEESVKMIRLNLYNKELFCGAQAILWEMEDLNVIPLPSERTINRILARNDLTHKRTGPYEPKGTIYPALPAERPNQTHQADLVGPRYLKGPIRFYSHHAVDLAAGRCGVEPIPGKDSQNIINGFWGIWNRMGIPENLQIDNEAAFCGSRRHPRSMGSLIRLCLHNGVEPWFIPVSEPWRNGVVEWFNKHYKQKFLRKITIASWDDLLEASLAFEYKHNNRHRYSKLGGKTPLKVLAFSGATLVFPKEKTPPVHPISKPETGHYHLVRLIRSKLRIDIFGETFPVAPELQHQYVVATIDVKEQRLKLVHNKVQVDEFKYKL
jgi:putative transposase